MGLSQREQIDLFLATYKELESLIDQNYGQSVFEYESALDGVLSKKLQLCRNIRNYVQHNEDGFVFVSVSDGMLEFLKGLCTQERSYLSKNDQMLLKPFVKRKVSDSVLSGAKLLISKDLQQIPVLDDDKKLVGVLTRENMIRISYLYELNDRLLFQDVLRVVKPDTKKILFVESKGNAKETFEFVKNGSFDMILVTSDGTKNGKILGQMPLS